MYKTIKVHDCAECPYRRRRNVPHTSFDYCGKDKYIEDYVEHDKLDIKDITTIPDWCPLEDKY